MTNLIANMLENLEFNIIWSQDAFSCKKIIFLMNLVIKKNKNKKTIEKNIKTKKKEKRFSYKILLSLKYVHK